MTFGLARCFCCRFFLVHSNGSWFGSLNAKGKPTLRSEPGLSPHSSLSQLPVPFEIRPGSERLRPKAAGRVRLSHVNHRTKLIAFTDTIKSMRKTTGVRINKTKRPGRDSCRQKVNPIDEITRPLNEISAVGSYNKIDYNGAIGKQDGNRKSYQRLSSLRR